MSHDDSLPNDVETLNHKIAVLPFERRMRAGPAGTPAARAHRLSAAGDLSLLWRQGLAQDRRGRDRDTGADPAAVEGDPACAREALLPDPRGDHTAPSPSHPIARGPAGPKLAHVL